MKRLLLLVLSFTQFFFIQAQVSEDFSDNDFLNMPPWVGDINNFEVLSQELHLLAPAVDDLSYLATSSGSINDAVWEFKIRMNFNPSSSNYAKFYLASDSANLKGEVHGYFVKIGSSADDVSLIKQDGLSETVLINGTDGIINFSTVDISIRVTRDAFGNWELFSDVGSTGSYISEGTASDDTFVKSVYCGFACKYTSTRADKFYLDNVMITGAPYVDLVPPQIVNYTILSQESLAIYFDEPVSSASVLAQKFSINSLTSLQASVDPINPKLIFVVAQKPFSNGFQHELQVQAISDYNGNVSGNLVITFLYFVEIPAEPYNIILNEIFPDPSPVIELPESEFIELFNNSSKPFQLNGWKISDGTTVATLGSHLLLPDSLLILCPGSYADQYANYGSVVSVSPWPSQNNSGDKLLLIDPSGLIIDSILYTTAWYQDPEKQSGGYSLEKVNPGLNCNSPGNWHGSKNLSGGTPGSQNSVFSLVPDETPPQIVMADFITPDLIQLFLDEPIRRETFQQLAFMITPQIPLDSSKYTEPGLSFLIYLSDSIQNETSYQIQISGPADCSGNILNATFSLQLDFLPPQIIEVTIQHPNELILHFDEPPVSSSLTNTNFLMEELSPSKVVSLDSVHVSLSFSAELQDSKEYLLTYQNLKDFQGNTGNGSFVFQYVAPPEPHFLDLLITEIMIDPEPGLGTLPITQYVEIFNNSASTFSLKGLSLSDHGSQTTSSSGLLPPQSFALLVPSSQKSEFPSVPAIGLTNWPALNKAGDVVTVKNRNGDLLHQVQYKDSWYKDSQKAEGGWSLEMIDFSNPCGEITNWTSSDSPTGGTPGAANSVAAGNPDNFGPEITHIVPLDSTHLYLEFSEWIHPEKIPSVSILPEISINDPEISPANPKAVLMELQQPLLPKIPYRISTLAIDCKGNQSALTSSEFYLPEEGTFNDVVINEILFNPVPGGADFIELFNRSDKHLLLSGWEIHSYADPQNPALELVTTDYLLLKPGEYRVLTSDLASFSSHYPFVELENVIVMNLPPLPDESGMVVLASGKNLVIDSVYYNEGWHHPLLDSNEGVSLERRSAEVSSLDPNNWKSAASTVGFATPGLPNSQAYVVTDHLEISVLPKLIFPGTGGSDSFSTVEYFFIQPDLVANIAIYSGTGLLVKHLAVNQLLATQGIFTWDGTDDAGNKVLVGHYFIVFDVFAPDGYKKRYREMVAVGAR